MNLDRANKREAPPIIEDRRVVYRAILILLILILRIISNLYSSRI